MDRNTFKEKAKKSIDDLFSRMDELELKKEKVQGEAKLRYDEKITQLKTKRAELQQKFQNMKDASPEKWEEAKEAFNKSLDSLKDGFSKLAELFK
jgi:hypothetical protein